MSEALRSHERQQQIGEQGECDQQPDDLDAAHTRSNASTRRNSALNASSAKTSDEPSWSESRMDAKNMPLMVDRRASRPRADARARHQDLVKARSDSRRRGRSARTAG